MVQPQFELVVTEDAPLTFGEASRLHRNESVIEGGLKSFVDVGLALLDIRDGRLYREKHSSFPAYLHDRWPQIGSRRQADRLIAAAEVTQNLGPIGLIPANEAQARPLTDLDPTEQPIAWQEAVNRSNGQPTAKIVEQVVREMRDESPVVLQDIDAAAHHAHDVRSPLMRVMGSSESPEWYTPQHIIDRVIETMGAIDLDPCSNSDDPTLANVPATRCYTEQTDGLTHEWPGRVYLNPPYGRVIGDWVARLIHQFEMDITTEAIALLPARTDTDWFQPLIRRGYLICLVDGRLKFSDAENSAPFPSAIVYLGENPGCFKRAFFDIGPIVRLDA